MNESFIFQWVLCHIIISYPLFLQTWCSVIYTSCICQESAIQLSSWQSVPKYRRENIDDMMSNINISCFGITSLFSMAWQIWLWRKGYKARLIIAAPNNALKQLSKHGLLFSSYFSTKFNQIVKNANISLAQILFGLLRPTSQSLPVLRNHFQGKKPSPCPLLISPRCTLRFLMINF